VDLRERQKNVISAGVLAAAVARDAFPSVQARNATIAAPHHCRARNQFALQESCSFCDGRTLTG